MAEHMDWRHPAHHSGCSSSLKPNEMFSVWMHARVRGKNHQRADGSVSSGGGELGATGRGWLWAGSRGWAVSAEQVRAAALTHALFIHFSCLIFMPA